MGKFLKALQKAGLVDLEEASSDAVADADLIASGQKSRLLPSELKGPQVAFSRKTSAAASGPPAQGESLPVPTETLPPEQCDIDEQRSFEAIYSALEVPGSPFPAEKMLRLLDGLKAMDIGTRTAAVRAMDAADDAWTVDDAVLDAQRKIRALQEAKAHVGQQAESARLHADEQLKLREEKHQQSVGAVRQQIADLEKLLEREVEKAAADKNEITGKARSAQEACTRETRRLDTELARLQAILDTFAAPAPAPVPRNA